MLSLFLVILLALSVNAQQNCTYEKEKQCGIDAALCGYDCYRDYPDLNKCIECFTSLFEGCCQCFFDKCSIGSLQRERFLEKIRPVWYNLKHIDLKALETRIN